MGVGYLVSVFAAGLLSFFSPCILPLVPMYAAYLTTDEDGSNIGMPARLTRAVAFVVGLSSALLSLGLGAGTLGGVLTSPWIAIVCGLLLLLFGLHSAGVITIPLLEGSASLRPPLGSNFAAPAAPSCSASRSRWDGRRTSAQSSPRCSRLPQLGAAPSKACCCSRSTPRASAYPSLRWPSARAPFSPG